MGDFANGIVFGIDPVAVQVGPLVLRWYGVFVALGIAVGIYVVLAEGRRRGLGEDSLYTCALWAILAGIVGARLLHVIDQADFYLQNPGLSLSLGQGGLAMWGAILGGVLATIVYGRLRHLPVARIFDAAAPALVVGQMIGRIGSLINGDAWGSTTNLPWGFIYTSPEALMPPTSLGVPTHPYPLYEIIWGLATLGVLLLLRGWLRTDGLLFLVYLVVYSVGRFSLSFVREEPLALMGFQQAQVIAVITLALALPVLVYRLIVYEMLAHHEQAARAVEA